MLACGRKGGIVTLLIAAGLLGWVTGPVEAAVHVEGQVQAGGGSVAGSTVSLWAASAESPVRLAQVQSDADGNFVISVDQTPSGASSFYLIANGGTAAISRASGANAAIALLAVLGGTPPARVIVNEFTTVASVWTHAQFLNGTAIQGNALGLRIAAGNVANFVDITTGGWGEAIQGPLNSGQTPTMGNFATLADVLAGCTTRVVEDACAKLFVAATPPKGSAPTDTLTSAESIARYPWYQPGRVFALLDQFYPVPPVKMDGQPKPPNMRPVPFMPYLIWVPSAWVLPLKFDGGGYRAGGKAMFDSEGNLWVGDNFTIGWQGQDALWQGNATKFAPNGKPLSPITTGFTGGGMEGGTFGAAVDAHDNAWFTTYGGHSIAVFDKNGKPLTPAEGITFGGRLGLMQGIIVTPSGDVWALGASKSQLIYFPKGDLTKGRIVCEGAAEEPCKSFLGPFHLAIDQQDRIWVANAFAEHVTRFPAADPTKAETFYSGASPAGMNVDSQGNVWVTTRFGNGLMGKFHLADMDVHAKLGGVVPGMDYMTTTMSTQQGGTDHSGSVTLLRPDGTPYPGSPFTGGGLPGPWAVVVDGNDNVWISNFAMPDSPIVQLCGVRTETCPLGMNTGDQISPPGGYVGGGLQMQTDIAIDPAGNVWVMNNWQDIASCIGKPQEALSTRCGGQGVVIFYGMAKPVQTPQIGPARAP
jgi:hypothetical protein